MFSILICDDDPFFTEALKAHVLQCFQNHQIDVNLQICHSGEAFRQAISRQLPDLAFIDLMLEDEIGFRLAEALHNLHAKTEIVFVTSYSEHMQKAFPYRPIGFIPKPIAFTDIDEVISHFLSYYRTEEPYYYINTKDQVMQVLLHSIQYFESLGHHVLVYLADTLMPLRQLCRLDEVSNLLASRHFVRTHKSFLVNLDAIERIDKSNMQLMLKGGKTLPISRSFYPQVVDAFVRYQFK